MKKNIMIVMIFLMSMCYFGIAKQEEVYAENTFTFTYGKSADGKFYDSVDELQSETLGNETFEEVHINIAGE